eukprot:GHVN01069130.1.p1 GENE.GHVN01069130.1~~GHVN01069130.1.p1  ORF type:complete len:212 (+),score=18.08 GHVN01069130.1:821-1456(+)
MPEASFPRTSPNDVRVLEEIENLGLHPRLTAAATFKPSVTTRQTKTHWKRNAPQGGRTKYNDWSDVKPTTLTERAAMVESTRCLKCADAPCVKGCPTSINIKQFIQCISTRNYYGAAKIILTDNPIGLSCGMVCPTSELCSGNCNLAAVEEGAINIGGLQQFAVEQFMKMGVAQTIPPNTTSSNSPIALIGSGPASLCCANFLARLGKSKG